MKSRHSKNTLNDDFRTNASLSLLCRASYMLTEKRVMNDK